MVPVRRPTAKAKERRNDVAKSDAAGMPDGRDGINRMGWMSLPYSCVGLVRKTGAAKNNTVWSWLILMPWSSDTKPWIDGTEVVGASTLTESEDRPDRRQNAHSARRTLRRNRRQRRSR